MDMHRKLLIFISLSFLSGVFSSYAQAAGTVLLYSDDFELGLGNWANVTSGDNKNWTRDASGTPSSGTGPISGAGGSSYYMYLETSSGSAYNLGDSAILQSPIVSGSNLHLHFQYHMYGSNTGTLAVDVFNNGNWINNVWSISGQQQFSNSASYTVVDLDLSAYAASQIRFRATAAGGYTGDIAIDKVEIWDSPAGPVAPVFNNDSLNKADAFQEQPYSDSIAADAIDGNADPLIFSKISGPAWMNVAANGVLSGTPLASDVGINTFIVEVSDGALSNTATLIINVNDNSTPVILFSDNFELNQGNWINVTSGDNKNWTRDASGTPSSGTGPNSGAGGSSYYMYLETSSGAAYTLGDSAILQSPAISGSNIHLAFKYHMYGTNIGTLAVDVLSDSTWINNVWSISGQQQTSYSAVYTAVDVDLSSYNITQVRFRATAAGGYTGDIAIDDLEISMHFSPEDDDTDGVLNAVDQCPNTPSNETADSTGCSPSQKDSDNDGVLDSNDPFPLDPKEWLDTDGDGIGNNTDTDDDDDGALDVNDAFPLNSSESVDTDGDLIGNNADTDDDNDGVLDINDGYPLISTSGFTDTDGDGVPNDCDASCLALGMLGDNDDDNDGVNDAVDAFPLNSSESVDTDGDLIGNNADTDDDNDGVLDINDAYPLINIGALTDTDGDGIPNDCDASCLALGMLGDTDDDDDGALDVNDAFPLNSSESVDTDGDLIGNNADTDDDNDGVLDINDGYPLISTSGFTDTDGDGVPNDCDASCLALGMLADSDDDSDGISDAEEILNGTDPLLKDSDIDGWNDNIELACATEGNNILSVPVDSDADQLCDFLDVDSDGDGLIEIHNLTMLNNMRYVLDGSSYYDGVEFTNNGCGNGSTVTACNGYELSANLDFDENLNSLRDDQFNSGAGWVPVGTDTQQFTAIFDGNNFEIQNLYLSSNSGFAGFISKINATTIKNVHFKNASINSGVANYAGILSGAVLNSTIQNVSVNGEVNTLSGLIGGLTGSFSGNMNKVSADVDVVGTERVGGLIGLNSGTLSEVYSTGSVSGSADNVGGLTGINGIGVTISQCFSSSNVTSSGNYVGGLVGLNNGSIFNCYSEGFVDGDSYVGGFIGENNSAGEVRYNFSTGKVTGSGQYVEGFLGFRVTGTVYPVIWDKNNTEQQYGGSGLPKTTIEMQTAIDNTTPYSGWDNSLWNFGTSSQYPGIIINNVVYRDVDSDNDTVNDDLDAFPYDRTESVDTDSDGVGDNTDLCVSIVIPLTSDNDKDGCDDTTNDDDDDNDGVLDAMDLFPLDPLESSDSDGDGIGDNADTDDDNDGFTDAQEQHFSSNPYDALDKPKMVMSELYTFEGMDIDGSFGADVAAVGDLNGDGYSEIIIGAYKVDNYRGRVQVYSGIDGTLMYEILGDDQIDYFGYVVSEAGDVNADGFNDFIISRYRDSANNLMSQAYSGEARVYSGVNGQVLYNLFGDAAVNERDNFGLSASGAGDVNNDGFDDIIVGAPQDKNGGSYASGSAQVFSGQDGSVLYKFKADASGDLFGDSVAAAGDINGDGYDDIAVGAPWADGAGNNRGLVRLFSGFDGSIIYDLFGDVDNDDFGREIKSLGDINNDGYPDLVAGAPYSDEGGSSSGKVKILSGVDGVVLFEIIGAASSEFLGGSVSNINDVNGDLIPDVVLGIANNDQKGLNAGQIQVVSGIDGTPLFTLYGENAEDYFGLAVSGLSDINGDGFGDLIVGASGYDGTGDKTGKVYVYVTDSDLDSDGVGSLNDAFPLDPTESVDTDGDLIGNNADTDDDNDGVLDINDAFPLDPTEWLDTDGDGVGDNADAFPNDNTKS